MGSSKRSSDCLRAHYEKVDIVLWILQELVNIIHDYCVPELPFTYSRGTLFSNARREFPHADFEKYIGDAIVSQDPSLDKETMSTGEVAWILKLEADRLWSVWKELEPDVDLETVNPIILHDSDSS